MPLTAFIEAQKQGIRRFIEDPATNLLVLRVDPEMEVAAAKVVASFEDDTDVSWAFFAGSVSFDDAEPYYRELAESILQDFEALRELPPDAGIQVRPPAEMLAPDGGPSLSPEVVFVELLERISRELRPYCDAVVVVLKPERIRNTERWGASVRALASATADPAVKYIVFDARQAPALGAPELRADRAVARRLPRPYAARERLVGEFLASPTSRVLLLSTESVAAAHEVFAALGTGTTTLQIPLAPLTQPAELYHAAVVHIAKIFAARDDARERAAVLALCRAFRGGRRGEPMEPRFCRFAEALQDAVSPGGRLVLVLVPAGIRLTDRFHESIEALVHAASHPRVKYVWVDGVDGSLLPPLEPRAYRAAVQTFYFSPAEIRDGVAAKLSSGSLTPLETMRYTAVLGGFAFAERDYATAEEFQFRWLEQAVRTNSAADRANAHYNLGNTYLAVGQWAAAEEQLTYGAEVCLDAKMDVLLAMCLNNLALAIYRQGRGEMALESFQAARNTFRGLNHRPGEAHVLDSMAGVYAEAGRPEIAAQLRREAVALYDGITEPALADVRESGRAGLLAKLNPQP